ncbi:MAG: alpha-amylase family protein [Trueperaceae bacterium]|nr:alpha-amylase family protein [Trueperaceae bacterium]
MQNVLFLTADARGRFERALVAAREELAALAPRDRDLFEARLERWFQHLDDGLAAVYGRRPDFAEFVERLVRALARHAVARPEPLKRLDLERDLTPDWFQRERMVGYVFYVERFGGTLRGVLEHLDYLEELGATYVHLMYVLRPREGENDGGYAIADYLDVDPRLGTIDDLTALCEALRERGIATCVDLVLNHCADTHAWAQAARAGDERYRGYFYTYPDRQEPDAFERTLPEVFPDFAPGNFTWDEAMGRWVWTTFNAYQWDLAWSNPEVFLEVVEIMGALANRGVDVFRMDAVAFLWKRLGTDSQNQPEVHDLLQALRACSKIATPAVAHKAEAIVSPGDLIHYFGTGRRYGKVANVAYHNSLMVQTWSALASRDARLMTHALRAFPPTPSSIAWGCYVRCHDDIGWAITDEDAAAVGLSGAAHRSFLSDFYSGQFPGTFARGAVFQYNPATGDRRISGSCASLAGIEAALDAGDEQALALAIERVLWAHAVAVGFGGIPLLYMGDEFGLVSDHGYLLDPDRSADNRWMHRPAMDWTAADRRHLPGTVEARVYHGLATILRARSRTPHLHAQTPQEVLDLGHERVFATLRRHPLGPMVGLYNVTEDVQRVSATVLEAHGLGQPYDQLEQRFVDVRGSVLLRPYDRLWLV